VGTKKDRKFLLVIDGPMGSGKTTVSKLLHAKLKRTAHLGLDRIKWFISDFKRIPADNEIVRNVVLVMAKEYLRQGVSVIIEQGMRKKQISILRRVTKQYGARFFIYQLDAPKKLLFRRIKQRPKKPGKPRVSNARIERNYKSHMRYKYAGAVVLDAEKMSARQIANLIRRGLES
jgi:predicted kinase